MKQNKTGSKKKGSGFAPAHELQRLTTPRCFAFGPAQGLAVPSGLPLEASPSTLVAKTAAQAVFAAPAEHEAVQDFVGGPRGQIEALAIAC